MVERAITGAFWNRGSHQLQIIPPLLFCKAFFYVKDEEFLCAFGSSQVNNISYKKQQ